jgi:hypothetical protein
MAWFDAAQILARKGSARRWSIANRRRIDYSSTLQAQK